jgi:hypothetical protein
MWGKDAGRGKKSFSSFGIGGTLIPMLRERTWAAKGTQLVENKSSLIFGLFFISLGLRFKAIENRSASARLGWDVFNPVIENGPRCSFSMGSL